jgi:homoserine O-acetyltransferase
MLLFFASALLFGDLGDVRLESGQALRDVKVGYRTFGELNREKSNVVLFPSWFNGTTEDLLDYIGPGGLVDASRYYVIALDAIGNGVSTSPSNSASQKGQVFPKISLRDMVETQYLLLTKKLGISRAHAVMGVSMGGMQAFQWAVQHPEFAARAISIVGTPRMSQKDMALWGTFLKLPGRGGDGANGGGLPRVGPKDLMDLLKIVPWRRIPGIPPQTREQLANVLSGGRSSPADRDPLDVLRQFDAMAEHDIGRYAGGTLESAARRIQAKMQIIVATQDRAVSPETPLEFARLLGVAPVTTDSSCGHSAFKCEKAALGEKVNAFLAAP